jgi:RNA ligase
MNYDFPMIRHLDDVRPAIAGRDEFIIAERDWGYVVNYMVAMTDTFPPVLDNEYWCPGCKMPVSETEGCGSQRCPDAVNLAAIRRECRGLLFNKDGSIMARRLHKFFNVNERDETQFGVIDFSKPHVILEKLDGSMITPVITDAGIRWGTKMGITDVSMGAELFVATHPEYEQFARWCQSMRLTPIFEWCSRKQRIVVDYPEDRLVLIALRGTVTGEYKQYCDLVVLGDKFNIEVVKTYEGTAANMSHLMDETKSAEGLEGYIIRFDDGHMLKIKGEWYLRIHKTKDNLTHEKNVVDLLITEKMDDAKAFMMDEDRKRVEAFETEFWEGIAQEVVNYDKYFAMVLAAGLDRKRFALEWMPTITPQDPYAANIVFGLFNGKVTRQMVLDIIAKNCGTQTKINSVRSLWGGNAQWNYHFDGDE